MSRTDELIKLADEVYAKEIDCLRARDKWAAERIEQLERELAASQAREAQMREALKKIAEWKQHTIKFAVEFGSNGVRDAYRAIAKDALALPTDNTALRQAIAKELRARANTPGGVPLLPFELLHRADELENGK